MNEPTEFDLMKSVQDLKYKIDNCQTEHNHIMKLACSLNISKNDSSFIAEAQFSRSGGDTEDVYRNKSNNTTNLASKLTHEEYLSRLIKTTSEENLRLRESNVKLKQESKVQDHKIRELNRKIKQHERNLHETESQRLLIQDLKDAVGKKNGEIRLLRQNLNDVKLSLKKEQSKSKNIYKRQEISVPKSVASREIKSKVESLLLQVDLLLKDQEQTKKIICFSDRYYNKIQTLLSKLVFLKSKTVQNTEDSVGNIRNETTTLCSKADKSVQVSDIGDAKENTSMTGFAKSETEISLFKYKNTITTNRKPRHRKSKSV